MFSENQGSDKKILDEAQFTNAVNEKKDELVIYAMSYGYEGKLNGFLNKKTLLIEDILCSHEIFCADIFADKRGNDVKFAELEEVTKNCKEQIRSVYEQSKSIFLSGLPEGNVDVDNLFSINSVNLPAYNPTNISQTNPQQQIAPAPAQPQITIKSFDQFKVEFFAKFGIAPNSSLTEAQKIQAIKSKVAAQGYGADEVVNTLNDALLSLPEADFGTAVEGLINQSYTEYTNNKTASGLGGWFH
jgi:hypothetical protein